MSLVPSVNGFEIDAGQEIPGEFEEISFAPVAGIIKFPENTSDPDAIPPHDCKPFDIDSDLPMEEYCSTGIPHSPCDPMPITVDVPCYTTVYVDTLPEEGIQGIMYVVPNGDLYAVYMWDGEQFNAVTSSSILQALTVNPSTSAQDILPEQGYDGFSSVHVNPIPPEYIIPSGTKNITQNGNGQDVAAYEYVNVNVPTVTPTGEKTINVSQNGTVTEDVTNYASAKVVTNVPNTYSASDEGKVVQNGALASQTSLTVNQNGTYVTTTNNEVVVDVSGGAAIAIEDVPNATGVECQITGDYSGGTVMQDANGYVILSPDGTKKRDLELEASLIGKTFSGVYSNSAVITVGSSGLAKMSAMTGVDLPNCTTIYDSGFRYSGLTSVYLPKAFCPQSHNYAFGNCTSLETAVLPATHGQNNLTLGFYNDTALRAVDLGDPSINTPTSFTNQVFSGCSALETIVLRYTAILLGIQNLNVFNGTPFANGGTGGTIYIPQSLYSHLGDGTALDYKSATNWSTIDGYGTITWAAIEGSQYETAYVDGTPIE